MSEIKESEAKVSGVSNSLEEYVDNNGRVWKQMSADCSITTGFITKVDILHTAGGGIHYTFIMKIPVIMSFDENLENEIFYNDVQDFCEICEFVSCAYSSIPDESHELIKEGNYVTVCHQSFALVPGSKSREGIQEAARVKKFALKIMEATNEPEDYLYSLVGTRDREERRLRVLEGWSEKIWKDAIKDSKKNEKRRKQFCDS